MKTVFKAVKKPALAIRGIDRVYYRSVSPVVLTDMTSGYNVGEIIYLKAAFNDLCGFTEAEIDTVLARMGRGGRFMVCGGSLGYDADLHNGYCFSETSGERLDNYAEPVFFLKPADRRPLSAGDA